MAFRLVACVLWLALVSCAPAPEAPAPTGENHAPAARPGWAVAIHGGAGVIPRSMDDTDRAAYERGLIEALELARSILDAGGVSLDAVERVIVLLEDNPRFNAGKGAVYNNDGVHELDASIMNGRDLSCGGVAGVTSVRNPIVLARRVMEQTDHVLLAGAGAERFAREQGIESVPQSYFGTEYRLRQLRNKQQARAQAGAEHGTVGVVALDRQGNLAAGTSTGGLTGKLYGRVGDSPIIGAGTYADNATCAVSGTGTGEEFIRHGAARRVSDLMQDRGLTLAGAVRVVVHDLLEPGEGGLIAVDRSGEIAMDFNSEGMYRGAADAFGRFEVRIWE